MNETMNIGIDVGSLFLKIVQIEQSGNIRASTYREHQGQPIHVLQQELPKYLNGMSLQIGVTGDLAGSITKLFDINPIAIESSLISSIKYRIPDVRNIIDIGGVTLTLIRLNVSGELEGITQNSLCAAGTGSFLDEQATRLDISYKDLTKLSAVKTPPAIATRCAVFAKSDLVHHQQAGRSKIECWVGLCHSMVRTSLNTLLKGRPIEGLTVVVGGVSLNPEIVLKLKTIYGDQIVFLEDGHLAGAFGAALQARDVLFPEQFESYKLRYTKAQKRSPRRESFETRAPLKLIRSKYPSWDVEEYLIDDRNNEIRITSIPNTKDVTCYIGIDIGSTSTKLAVIDQTGKIICDIYRATAGDPIGSTKELFKALLQISRRKDFQFDVRGCATTGSGRKMVGDIIGADLIINEITCHVAGAVHVDPEIDTIFEIGGQDSKYMRLRNGGIIDANMNYVCAAGTGSFIEEQSRKLGYSVKEIGNVVMGITPPFTSDRCTVFMEQDINRLLRVGFSKEEVLAAVMYSIAQNYLNRVVGQRSYSDKKIFFQGATARNPGLVAAFESLLDVEMVVSPYAHVMGAWGAALLVRKAKKLDEKPGKFRMLDFIQRDVTLRSERCGLCTNNCEITFARLEGNSEETSWGYLCGREPGDSKARKNPHFRFFERREELFNTIGKVSLPKNAPKVGIPRVLANFTFMPLWRRFFGELGMDVVLSPQTNPNIKKLGPEIAGGEFCFPVKAALGHVHWITGKDEIENIFVPHIISARPNFFTYNSHLCPYVQSFPSVVRTSFELNGINTDKLLTPIIDFRWKEDQQVEELYCKLSPTLKIDRKSIERAWKAGCSSYVEFLNACMEEGEKALVEIENDERPAILILGRPYNTQDSGLNLGLVRKIAELGHTVIPYDLIPSDPSDLGELFRNIYWFYPQKILQSIKKIRENDNIFPVYFTNFNCGPDSFIEAYAQNIAGEKPILILELDEHDADAGYITRIEAFLDVVMGGSKKLSFPELVIPPASTEELKRRTIWIPNLHPIATPFFAAAFRSFGYKAEELPLENDESFEIGRRLTSGKECLPAVSTIGAFVEKLRSINAKPEEHAFFMATASGPCRFGQYALKSRMILNKLGYNDVIIFSPSSINSYQGIPEKLRRRVFTYITAADILMKLRCKIIPRALDKFRALQILEEEIFKLVNVIESGKNFKRAFVESLKKLETVDCTNGLKPLVGIVGEIYVRSNSFTNNNIIEDIENYGGEVWLAPFSEWILYTSFIQKWRAQQNLHGIVYRGLSVLKNVYMKRVENKMYKLAHKWMYDRCEPHIGDIINEGGKYLPINFEGEAILTIGRAVEFINNGAAMIVNCSPFSCMPGTITGLILQKIQSQTGIPIVSIFYDGKSDLNKVLGIHLNQILRNNGNK